MWTCLVLSGCTLLAARACSLEEDGYFTYILSNCECGKNPDEFFARGKTVNDNNSNGTEATGTTGSGSLSDESHADKNRNQSPV